MTDTCTINTVRAKELAALAAMHEMKPSDNPNVMQDVLLVVVRSTGSDSIAVDVTGMVKQFGKMRVVTRTKEFDHPSREYRMEKGDVAISGEDLQLWINKVIHNYGYYMVPGHRLVNRNSKSKLDISEFRDNVEIQVPTTQDYLYRLNPDDAGDA